MANIAVVDSNRLGIRMLERAKKLGHTVTFIRSATDNMYTLDDYVEQVFSTLDTVITVRDSTSYPDVKKCLAEVHRTSPFDAIITVNEYALETAVSVARTLGVASTTPDAVFAARDKYQMRQILGRTGLSPIAFRLADSVDEIIAASAGMPYPLMVKPTRSCESLLAKVVSSAKELAFAVSEIRSEYANLSVIMQGRISQSFILEEFITGPMFSAEFALANGEFYDFMISERIQATHDATIELGNIMPSTLSSAVQQQCFNYVHRVAQALGFETGVFHFEFILTQHGPVLVEANPRLMGGSMPYLYDFLTNKYIHDQVLNIHLQQPAEVANIPAGRFVVSLRLEARQPGIISALPVLSDIRALSIKVLLFETYYQVGDRVSAGDIIGRLNIDVSQPDNPREQVKTIWERCEAIVGIPLSI